MGSGVDPRRRIIYVVCSITKSVALYLSVTATGQNDETGKESRFRVCEEIVDIGIKHCVSGQVTEAGRRVNRVVVGLFSFLDLLTFGDTYRRL